MWLFSQTLRGEAASWTDFRAPDVEINKLLAAVHDAEAWILAEKPSFPELRHMRGEVRWPDVLGCADRPAAGDRRCVHRGIAGR